MKIELTELQGERLIEAANAMFQKTHNAFWFGLQVNLESQIKWKDQKRPYVLDWLKENFRPIENVIDVFGRSYTAMPKFQEHKLKTSIQTVDENIGGIKIRYHQYSPMSQTKSYTILYEILKQSL